MGYTRKKGKLASSRKNRKPYMSTPSEGKADCKDLLFHGLFHGIRAGKVFFYIAPDTCYNKSGFLRGDPLSAH